MDYYVGTTESRQHAGPESILFNDVVEDMFCHSCVDPRSIGEDCAACVMCLTKVDSSLGKNKVVWGTYEQYVYILGHEEPVLFIKEDKTVACDTCIERYRLKRIDERI